MPRFEYQFDTKIDDRGRKIKRRLRLVVLFLLVSALTAGIIYWIIPKKTSETADANTAAAVQENNAGNEEKPKAADAEKADSEKSVSPDKKDSGTAVVSDNQNNKDDSAKEEPVVAEPVISETDRAQQDEKPEKGKVWAGDPANDVPSAAENQNNVSVLDELKQLAEKNDWSNLANKSVEVIKNENEGSPNYRIAAKYLLSARLGQLSSNVGVQGISRRYTVRGGDSLSRIARRNKTTVSALMQYNRLNNGLIRIGRKFIVHPGPWKIEISKSNRLLKLYNGSENSTLFAVFEVGVGRFNSTPVGGFVISNRIKDPRWYSSDGRVFEPGEPGNELGQYFLKLAATGNPDRPFAGYGIHGTPDESTVGKSLSHGCVRMRNADVELLYNLVPERTPVTITD